MEFVYMRSVEDLLAEAVKKCQSQAELARQLGMHRQELNAMIKGNRPISPETVALLGDVMELPGEEVQRLAAMAIIDAAKNSSKRERLRKAFFGCWVAGVVATTLLIGAPKDAMAGTVSQYKGYPGVDITVYTLSRIRTTLRQARNHLRRLIQGARRRLRDGLARPFNREAWCA